MDYFKAETTYTMKTNLKALSKWELKAFCDTVHLPDYRMRQLLHWIYEKHAQSLEEITEFSKELRESLSQKAYISNLVTEKRQISQDGTEKFLFKLVDGETIESVLISDRDRLTLCISSQVGCALKCRFCLTGTLGFKRNLRAHEIVDQIITAQRIISPRQVTNIVFMGMGEPLANCAEVVGALWRITEFMKISKRRITVSTAGVVPGILDLAVKAPRVNLAVSLNATTDEVRDRIMPVNRRYPLKVLLDACRHFPLEPRQRITFEYVMIAGINDALEDARRMVRLLKGIPCKVNLIPFNEIMHTGLRCPSDAVIRHFQDILTGGHITALIRKSKGSDILAACGQLKAAYS